jgi:hypothetical protein
LQACAVWGMAAGQALPPMHIHDVLMHAQLTPEG